MLLLLVVSALVLLTASFGGGSDGPLRSLQRGVVEVVSPIQEGASRALKPVRDLFGWVGDTLDAKEERDELRAELREARNRAIALQGADRRAEDLEKLVGLNRQLGLDEMGPVAARVINKSPNLWYAQVTVNKGSSDGVRVDQPVVTGDGLVGVVEEATGGNAVVRLITDAGSAVYATVEAVPRRTRGGDLRAPRSRGVNGVVKPAVGDPGQLLLEGVRRVDGVQAGQDITTSGTRSRRLESLFPPGIPVGRVSEVDREEADVYQRVRLRPFADLRRLDTVQILTRPDTGQEPST